MSNCIPVWEQGSDFHFLDLLSVSTFNEDPFYHNNHRYYGSGRDAFICLINFGVLKYNWKRIFVPSYFCQEVVDCIHASGLDVVVYPDSPVQKFSFLAPISNGDVILVVNYFGLRCFVDNSELISRGAFVIEDHTHDPWSDWAKSSNAHFCVYSLRKCLPIPEGGLITSPHHLELPPHISITNTREIAFSKKLAGMLLKDLYLKGHDIDKLVYRTLLLDGESCIASGIPSGASEFTRLFINCFPIRMWREQRLRNFNYLASLFSSFKHFSLLLPEDPTSCVPFNFSILTANAQECLAIKNYLVSHSIYPACLWPLTSDINKSIPTEHVNLSRCILSIHCDARYSLSDLFNVMSIVSNFYSES